MSRSSQDEPAADGERRRDPGRERGAALVFVMLFGMAAMSLVMILLTLSESGVKHQTARRLDRELNNLLLEGVSRAIHEINLNQFKTDTERSADEVDPDGDGIGALLGSDLGGKELFADDGRSLGFVRAVVVKETVDGQDKRVLVVAAATPNFTRPERVVSAKLLIGRVLPPWLRDREAFSVVGPAGADGSGGVTVRNGAGLSITSAEAGVPAVNIEDPTWHDKFVDAVTAGNGAFNNKISISGSNSDGQIVSDSSTIVNEEAGLVDEQLAQDITEALDQLARDIMRSQNGYTGLELKKYIQDNYQAWPDRNGDGVQDHDDITDTIPGGTYVLPEGDYYLEAANTVISNQVNLSGTGNLVLGGNVTIKGGGGDTGGFAWDGKVIVTHETDESLGSGAGLHIENGTKVTIGPNDPNSVLAVNAGDANVGGEAVTYVADGGARVTVNGVFLLTSASGSTSEFADSGSRTVVNGIAMFVGEGIDYNVDSGGGWEVNGSMVFASPEGGGTAPNILLKSGSDSKFNFNNGNFEAGIETFSDLVEGIGVSQQTFPISLAAYMEEPGLAPALDALLAAHTTRLGWEDVIDDQRELP